MPCPLMTRAETAVPGREHDAVAERAEIEMADRAGIEHAVIGQHQRDRRIELAEAAQHPVLPHRLVVARDPHRAEQLLGDVDLPAAMHALIFAVADDVALRLGARHHLLHVALAHRSSGSPVRTWICQGWVFIEDGARLATSMISSITARGTGCFLKPRTLRRDWTSVSNSNSLDLPDPFIPWHCMHCQRVTGCRCGAQIYATPQARPRTQ